jgi:hypothetical protein
VLANSTVCMVFGSTLDRQVPGAKKLCPPLGWFGLNGRVALPKKARPTRGRRCFVGSYAICSFDR